MSILYAAFLRGINVGGHRIIKMEDLRRMFEAFGCRNVSTFIQSGNVIFESPKTGAEGLEEEIQAKLAKSLGYEVEIFLRTLRALEKIAAQSPFQEDENSTVYVAFLKKKPDRKAGQALLALQNKVDEFSIKDREVYCFRHKDKGESILSNNLLEKMLGTPATTRNMTSIRKILEKYG